MQTFLIRLLLFLAVTGLSCTRKTQFNMNWALDLGTNAVINIQKDLPGPGYYEFTLGFPVIDRNNYLDGKWPSEMETNLRVLAKVNGQVIVNTNVLKLEFSDYSNRRKLVEYNVLGFQVSQGEFECRFSDLSQEPRRPVKLMLFRAAAK